jgi:Mg-chelatase subunit ChlI
MSAIPDTLLEAELFGYEKGAFTGAEKRKLGKFELASGGTILLDEIGDMPLHLQPKILRVIQEKKIERLGQGSVNSVSVDVRVISTTNKDLENLVKEGKFREDLYYRLSVIPIKIPPLRERKEDITAEIEFVKSLRPDMVFRAWEKISHIGIQVQPDKTLPERMLLYSLAIKGKFGQKPVQIILFVGKGNPPPSTFKDEFTSHKFIVLDMKK